VPASQPGGGGKNHRVVKFKMTTTSSFPAPAKRGVCIFEVRRLFRQSRKSRDLPIRLKGFDDLTIFYGVLKKAC